MVISWDLMRLTTIYGLVCWENLKLLLGDFPAMFDDTGGYVTCKHEKKRL